MSKFSEQFCNDYWKNYVSRAEAYEAPAIHGLQQMFLKQKAHALSELQAGKQQVFDKAESIKEYTAIMQPILIQVMHGAIANGRELLRPPTPHKADPPLIPSVINVQALNWLKTRIGWAAQQIGEESALKLSQILADGFSQGLSTDDIAKNIGAVFDEFSAVRTKLIARTEVMAASSQGTIEGYQESGVVDKCEFFTAEDERTCEDCDSMNHEEFLTSDAVGVLPLHPNCLLPDVRVHASHLVSANRALYRGDAVEITTKYGHVLTCTPNHPILTPLGFMKAKSLNEGFYVISSSDSERIIASIDPDNNNIPTRIEDVWNTLGMQDGMLLSSVPITPEDFYGDAGSFDGNVDIVHPDSFLLSQISNSYISEHLNEYLFGSRYPTSPLLPAQRPSFAFCDSLIPSFSSNMGGGSSSLSLLGCHQCHRNSVSLAAIAGRNAISEQPLSDYVPAYVELSREFQLRFAGLVTADEIIKIRKFNYIGHVFDLQSLEQLYIGNGIVVKNCRCCWLPIID